MPIPLAIAASSTKVISLGVTPDSLTETVLRVKFFCYLQRKCITKTKA